MSKRRVWEDEVSLPHLLGDQRTKMEARRRHRQVRYLAFRIQTLLLQGKGLQGQITLPPGFAEFWLGEKPVYAIGPHGKKGPVPVNRQRTVESLGGWKNFAKTWDIDEELNVYLRHSSVWHQWENKLDQILPVLRIE